MKRLGSLAVLAVLLFYFAWPAYSGYTIKSALEAKDAELLSSKVDFDSVRQSLRPAVSARVERLMAEAVQKTGVAGGAIVDQVKAEMMPRLVEKALASLVTADMLIGIHANGLRVKETLDGVVAEKVSTGGLGGPGGTGTGETKGSYGELLGKLGKAAEQFGFDPGSGLGGLAGKTETAGPETVKAAGPAPRYGLANIKHAGLNGPLGLSVGIARDPGAREPDVTIEMGFTGNDWKLTGLVPRS